MRVPNDALTWTVAQGGAALLSKSTRLTGVAGILSILLNVGCVRGFTAGYPEGFYTTEPQDGTYRELQTVRSHVVGYGLARGAVKDHAQRRVYEKARALGADGVIGAKAKGFCIVPLALVLLPTCEAKAEGVAVVWE